MPVERPVTGLRFRDRERAAEAINKIITFDQAWGVLSLLQKPAPSGTEYYTRTPVIERLLIDADVPLGGGIFQTNFVGSGSPAVLLQLRKPLWISAHSDTVSYTVARPTNEAAIELMPLAAHRPEKGVREFPAAVLRFNLRSRRYEVISKGRIGCHQENPESKEYLKPYYIADTKPQSGFVPGFDRFVFSPTMSVDMETGLMQGNVDNAAGITVNILALKALAEIARKNWNSIKFRELPVGFVFPGAEEGLPEQNATFARGARQMINNLSPRDLPKKIVEVDGQGIEEGYAIPDSALLAAYVSGGKGAIVAPHYYAQFEAFLRELVPLGVRVEQSEAVHATVSRSNDPAWIERVKTVVPIGYGERWPHFNKGVPETNINALVNNAKAIVWMAINM